MVAELDARLSFAQRLEGEFDSRRGVHLERKASAVTSAEARARKILVLPGDHRTTLARALLVRELGPHDGPSVLKRLVAELRPKRGEPPFVIRTRALARVAREPVR